MQLRNECAQLFDRSRGLIKWSKPGLQVVLSMWIYQETRQFGTKIIWMLRCSLNSHRSHYSGEIPGPSRLPIAKVSMWLCGRITGTHKWWAPVTTELVVRLRDYFCRIHTNLSHRDQTKYLCTHSGNIASNDKIQCCFFCHNGIVVSQRPTMCIFRVTIR